MKKKYVQFGLFQLFLLALLIAITWGQGLEWWRFLLLILGACFALPIAVGFVRAKLAPVTSGKRASFRMGINALLGTILMGGGLTLFSYLGGSFDRFVRHILVQVIGFLVLGALYALALEMSKMKREASKPK